MITEKEIVEIGKFQKTHALKGELNAILDIEPDYAENNPLIVDIDGIYVPFYTESIRPKGKTSYLIKLKGIDNVDAAAELVNNIIYGLRKDLLGYFDSSEEEIVFDNDLIGYDVEDLTLGIIGKVKSIEDSTMNILIIVDGPNGEIYTPYNENFIEEIDYDDKKIVMDLPEGLVHLNEKKQ